MTQRFLAFGLIFLLVPGPGSPQSLPPPPPPQSHTARPEPTPTPKPDQPPTFPAGVEQVTVDVVVTDKKGAPLADLKQDELQITEDGKSQAIVSFEAITVPAAPSAAPAVRPRVSTNTTREETRGRTFVIVFDDVHLTPQQAHNAKGAVTEFLKNGVREGDRVALIATGGGAWWATRMEAGRDELIALLKRLDGRLIPDMSQDRMSDWEAMRIHTFRDGQVISRVARRYEQYGVTQQMMQQRDQTRVDGQEDPYVTARATDVYFQATARNRITLEALERALSSLISTKGRKSLILVSEGFIYDPNLDEFKRVIEASRRSNAAIYFLNARGLEGMPVYMTAQFGPPLPEQDIGFAFSETFEASEGADSVASDSGGFSVRNTNDLGAGIKRIADENRTYYLVGYNPTNTARDGKFRKISVKVPGRKGIEVRARRGYYAPSDTGKTALTPKPGQDLQIQAALDSPYEMDQIPLRMTAYVGSESVIGKAQVMIATEVDIRTLAFEEKDGRFVDTVEFLLVAAHRETGEYFRYDQKMDMKLLPATRERMEKAGLPISRDFELKAGGYQAKIVVRDKNSGRVGTVVHEFEVPDLSKFRISTPLLSTTRQMENGQPTGKLQLQVRRDFTTEGPIFCSFEVFGAAKDPKSGMPRVMMGYVVRREDGSALTRVEPTEIRPTSLGHLNRMIGFPVDNASPGNYELVMTFKDEISGTSIELKEPFGILGTENPTPVADKPTGQ
jgi:VWFA-related protein